MSGKIAMFGSLLAWGGWGLASRMAVADAHPLTVQWLVAIPQILLLPLWYYFAQVKTAGVMPSLPTIGWAVGSCLMTVFANYLYSIALKTESPTAVITVTSAYPMITLFLLLLFGMESLSWTHGVGCILIIAGVTLVQMN